MSGDAEMLAPELAKRNAENAELRAELNYSKSLLNLSADTPVLKEYSRLDIMWQSLVQEKATLKAKLIEVEKENAELRDVEDRLHTAADQCEALKARLAWFEKREPLIRQGLTDEACSNGFDCCYEWAIVERWEAENPKPAEGT